MYRNSTQIGQFLVVFHLLSNYLIFLMPDLFITSDTGIFLQIAGTKNIDNCQIKNKMRQISQRVCGPDSHIVSTQIGHFKEKTSV